MANENIINLKMRINDDGSLQMVGYGKWSNQDLVDALKARDRSRCGPVAPATGLYLVAVDYPKLDVLQED